MLHTPMPSSSLSIRRRDFESRGCISSAATRTKKRGPANFSISSCLRRTWHTFWHRKHSMHGRYSCTRSTSSWYIFHSVPGRASHCGIFLFTRQFQETSVTRSLITGNAFIGYTVTGKRRGRNPGNVKELCELIDATRSSVTGSLAERTLLPKIPQQIAGPYSSENGSAVATKEDQFIQVLDLQAIVQRVAEAVRPVKQRQETQGKHIKPGKRQPDQGMQVFITRSRDPS